MGWRSYYWQWFKRSTFRVPNVGEQAVSFIAIVFAFAIGVRPALAGTINPGSWQVILGTFAIVMACRFVLVPYWMAKEQASTLAEIEADLAHTEAALADALRPRVPERNPDGIYQGGRLVGLAVAPRNEGAGQWSFERIDGAVDFDQTQPFEYRTYRMQHLGQDVDNRTATGGVPARALMIVAARVIE